MPETARRFGSEVVVRRTPTLYDEVRRVLTVRQIITPIDAVRGFELNDHAGEAAAQLEEHKYDFGSVVKEGRVIGRVARKDLLGALPDSRILDHVQPTSERIVVSADSGIHRLMHWLAADPWLFVLDGNELAGIVTPSDLNRQAARAYFYLLIADFEIRVAEAIRAHFDDQKSALGVLPAHRQRSVRTRFTGLQRHEVESDLVAAMGLLDLVEIATVVPAVREQLGLPEEEAWIAASGSVTALRNAIMHPTQPVLSDRAGLGGLIEMERWVHALFASMATES